LHNALARQPVRMAAAGDPFAALPHAVALSIFARLNVEQRLRCAEVCRGWRGTLSDAHLWLHLDLTHVLGWERTEALLDAAAARARGRLQSLALPARGGVRWPLLLRVAACNAGALRELRMRHRAFSVLEDSLVFAAALAVRDVAVLLRAAPALQQLDADVRCEDVDTMRPLLAGMPPFGPLRVRRLALPLQGHDEEAELALAPLLASHPTLQALHVNFFNVGNAVRAAVVEAAVTRRLETVSLEGCSLITRDVPLVTRLLRGGAVATLRVGGEEWPPFNDGADVAPLAAALHDCISLTCLSLDGVRLFQPEAMGAALLGALVGHPSLRVLYIHGEDSFGDAEPEPVGTALGALVAANAPALRELHAINWYLCDESLAPLADALLANTHLHVLKCDADDVSARFAADRLLPAVRANATLRMLRLVHDTEPDEARYGDTGPDARGGPDTWHALREAEALVRVRTEEAQ
jgi:hypothetical protein